MMTSKHRKTGEFLVDVDGVIVGTGLSEVTAHRLAWRNMSGVATCVDVCHQSDVHVPVAAWVKRRGRWRRGRLRPMTDTKLREAAQALSDHLDMYSLAVSEGTMRRLTDLRAALDAAPEADAAVELSLLRQRIGAWVPSKDGEHYFTDRDWLSMASGIRTLLKASLEATPPPPTRRSPEEIAREVFLEVASVLVEPDNYPRYLAKVAAGKVGLVEQMMRFAADDKRARVAIASIADRIRADRGE